MQLFLGHWDSKHIFRSALCCAVNCTHLLLTKTVFRRQGLPICRTIIHPSLFPFPFPFPFLCFSLSLLLFLLLFLFLSPFLFPLLDLVLFLRSDRNWAVLVVQMSRAPVLKRKGNQSITPPHNMRRDGHFRYF